ncbi:hypothetical protein RB195_001714 [Necator americanus]|uniref:Uncharacterized protein n=1 Tax=Necator americanus TaxID=51031 RepID=A0ABR1DFM3_NECAM
MLILLDSVKNSGVIDSVRASRLGLVFEVGVSACETSEPALDSPDDGGALAQSAFDVEGCCGCFNAAKSFIEDDNSKLLVTKVRGGPRPYIHIVEKLR